MFECDKCGLCCRSLSGVELYREMDRGDGTCRYFDEVTNLCKIYESRPLLCRVDDSYNAYFSSVMTREEYEKLNYDASAELKKIWGKECKLKTEDINWRQRDLKGE